MKKKLPMKGDPIPEWLRKKPLCPCTSPASHNINGRWFCEMCFQAGMEDADLLFAPLKRREADRELRRSEQEIVTQAGPLVER